MPGEAAQSRTDAVVGRFAVALDREDYAAAAALLAAGCVYLIRGETHTGPGAIIASYRGNGEHAARSFESITYSSSVRPDGPGSAQIEFADHIRHRGMSLTHRCRQVATLGAHGLIARIEHVDLPGERERLDAFRRDCGLSE